MKKNIYHLERLSEAREINMSRALGCSTSASEASMIMVQYRRGLATPFQRGQFLCLLARLGHMDEGARQAATMRQVTLREEEGLRREEWDYFQVHV